MTNIAEPALGNVSLWRYKEVITLSSAVVWTTGMFRGRGQAALAAKKRSRGLVAPQGSRMHTKVRTPSLS